MTLSCQLLCSNGVGNNAGNKLPKIRYKSFAFGVEHRKITDVSVHFDRASL